MTPFGILLIAHLIGDFLLQTRWMAMYKAQKWLPLLSHVAVYTSVIYGASYIGFGGLSLLGVAIIIVSHIFLDRRFFVQWWVRTVMGAGGSEEKWLCVVADQIFHVIFLAIALWVSI